MSEPRCRFAEDVGVLEYDPEIGEGEIRLSRDFYDADEIMQLDIISDWIGLLGRLYNRINEG